MREIDLGQISNVLDLMSEVITPRSSKIAERYERELLETALACGCIRVYVTDWSETHDGSWDYCYMAFPYDLRGEAFRLAREKDGKVVIHDFKKWVEMGDGEFSAYHDDSPNYRLAKEVRERWRMRHSISAP